MLEREYSVSRMNILDNKTCDNCGKAETFFYINDEAISQTRCTCSSIKPKKEKITFLTLLYAENSR